MAIPQAHHMVVKRGRPFRPSEPLVIVCVLVSTTRMISEKPSVAIAR